MPTMHTTTYTSVFSGLNVGPAFPQYNSFSISANTELSWPSGFQNLNPVVAVNMDITATAGGFTVKMPDAEGAGTGYAFKVNNPGNFSFNLIDNANNLILSVPSGTAKEIWLIDNSTVAGTWRTFPNPGGGSAVTSINATSSSNNLVVGGTPGLPITSAGTIQFSLANDLLALSSFGSSTGIAVRTAANTWALRSISGTVGRIDITNPSGIAGNMTISLSNTLTGLTSIGVGNLLLSGNTIAASNDVGHLILTTLGSGNIKLSKNTELLTGSALKFWNTGGTFYTSFVSGNTSVNQDLLWPTTVPTAGQALIHSGSGQLAWAAIPTTGGGTTLVSSLARYSNTGGGLTDSVVLLDGIGNLTYINSAKIGHIWLGTIGTATITTQDTNEPLTLAPNGAGIVECLTDLIIKKNSGVQPRLKLYDNTNILYAGIMANAAMSASCTWVLPATGNTAGFFYTDSSNNMTITPMTSFLPAASTLNAVARYSNTTGSPLKDSIFVISDLGAATGLISSVIGNISISTVANTISSSAGLTIQPAAASILALTTTGAAAINLSSGAGISATAVTSFGITAASFTNNAPTTFTNATVSSSVGTGALILSGGLSVALKAYIGGALNITDTTDSSSTSTGSGIFLGGIGLAKALTAGGIIKTTATTVSTSTTTGALISGGGLGVAGAMFIGGKITSTVAAASIGLDLSLTDAYANLRVIQNTNSGTDNHIYLGVGSGATSSILMYTNNARTATFEGGNLSVSTATGVFGGGVGVIAMLNATGIPAGATANTGILYVQAGALKFKGASGTITTIAVT